MSDELRQVLILAGGKGTRFWPLSSAQKPKQFLPLAGDKPMIRETLKRVLPLVGLENIFISTTKDQMKMAKKIVPEISALNYVLEPLPKNTAPAIGLAMAIISKRLKEKQKSSILAVLPSDHYIFPVSKFRATLRKAFSLAEKKRMVVLIGAKPDFPSTSFGYIKPGKSIEPEKKIYYVNRFLEKPNSKKAMKYIKKGYLWNCGIFVFPLSLMWELYKKHKPALYKAIKQIYISAGTKKQDKIIEKIFHKLENISIDYAILEKTKKMAVIEASFLWSDLGGFQAWYKILGGDGEKNISRGKLIEVNSKGLLVHAKKPVACVGVKNLVIVETEKEILVMDREYEAGLKELCEKL